MDENTVKILTCAKYLIQNKGWTKGYFASTKWLKLPVPAVSSKAHNFCMFGAIKRASKDLNLDYMEAYNILTFICGGSISKYNDETAKNKNDVINIFDLAILSSGGKV